MELVPKLAGMGLLGIRIPEEYGGSGMDTQAYAICVEEIARVDGSIALTVASHNGLGTGHVLAFGSEEQKRKYLPTAASGRVARGLGAHRAGERERLGGAADDRAPRRGRLGARRHEDVHHAGLASAASAWSSRAPTPSAPKQQGITAFVVEHGTPGFTASKHLLKLGCRSSDTAELTLENVRIPDAQRVGEVGQRLRRHDAHPRSRAHLDRGDGARPRLRRARDGRELREGAAARSASRSPSFRPSSGCWPTPRPSSTPPRCSPTAPPGWPTRASVTREEAAMAKLFASEAATRACNSAAPGPRRLRLRARVRRRAPPARREALRDRRGHQRSPAHGHRQARPRRLTRSATVARRRRGSRTASRLQPPDREVSRSAGRSPRST